MRQLISGGKMTPDVGLIDLEFHTFTHFWPAPQGAEVNPCYREQFDDWAQ